MKIIIEPYNPKWKIEFIKESILLINTIDEQGVKVEHIGSTSVRGLGAKPIIDIMIGLQDFNTANKHIKILEKLGYKYVPEYELTMPLRRFFTKELNGVKTHHIHMVALRTEFWNRHIAFRNYLRNNEKARREYYQLKVNLSQKEWNNGSEYANAKSDFIKKIQEKATEEYY